MTLYQKIFAFVIALTLCITGPHLAHAQKPVLDIKVLKSKNGIETWLVEDHSLPVISLNFSFEGGLALDPEDKAGVAKLTSILLDEGAGDIKSFEFQKELTDNAISMRFTPGRDAFYGGLKTVSANKATAFRLLKLALTQPRFDAEAVTRMKNANIAEIKNNLGDPSWLAARTYNSMLFGNHYYGAPGAGHLASMQSITAADLKDFVKNQFNKSGLKIAIAGDLTEAEAIQIVDDIFSTLPEGKNLQPEKPLTLQNAGKTVLLPLDTPQTHIMAGMQGIERTSADWHAASLMNFILGGGGFDARLMKEIREKRGLTYGIYSSLVTMKQANLVQISFSTSNDKAQEALQLMRSELEKMARDGVSKEELQDAKSYLIGSLLLELSSTGDIADVMSSLQRDNLPPKYLDDRRKMIESVTQADIKRIAQKLLKPDEMTIILVGQPQNINVDILLDKAPGMKDIQQQ